jgi:hypothetical protein
MGSIEKNISTRPTRVAADPPLAEGKRGAWGSVGSGLQLFQIKPGGSVFLIGLVQANREQKPKHERRIV